MPYHFGDTVKQAREAKQMRQEDLALALGVTQQAVQKWENGAFPPSRSQYLQPLCALLGIEAPEMMAPRVGLSRVGAESSFQRPRLRPTTEELIDQLATLVSPDEAKAVGAALTTKTIRVKFPYFSSKVVAHLVSGSPSGVSNLLLRSAAWRLALAKASGNFDLPDKHYLLGTINLPDGGDITAKLPGFFVTEASIMGIEVKQFPDVAAFLERIRELENTPTEADQAFSQFDEIDFDPNDLI